MSSDQSARQTTVPRADEKLARDADLARLQRRIRTLVSDLMRGVLDAVAMASPAEIGELIRTQADGRRRRRASSEIEHPKAEMPSTSAGRGANATSSRTVPFPREARARLDTRVHDHAKGHAAENEREPASFLLPQDPFAITSPSELLAFERKDTPNERLQTRDTVARPATVSAPSEPVLPTILESPMPLSAGDREVESERRPKIVLREGERLLSATGSGVVIRRERRVSPRR